MVIVNIHDKYKNAQFSKENKLLHIRYLAQTKKLTIKTYQDTNTK